MKNNIDEDIKILKEHINFKTQFTLLNHEQEQIEAIEHIISELETYKKIAEKLAEVVDLGYMPFECSPMCIHDNCIKECTLDWARKEVEKDE